MKQKYLDDLTAEYVRSILDYDPETGVFRWKVWRNNNAPIGSVAGAEAKTGDGYIRISIDNRLYLASRLAWLCVKGRWPTRQVDHKDTVRTNNRWTNLRLATNQQNCHNASINRRNTSGVKGVARSDYLDRVAWRAYASLNGRQYSFGRFKTIEEAAAARSEGIKKLHGRFARAGGTSGYRHHRDRRREKNDEAR